MPVAIEYLPAAHKLHWSAAVNREASEKVPVGQGLHNALPGADEKTPESGGKYMRLLTEEPAKLQAKHCPRLNSESTKKHCLLSVREISYMNLPHLTCVEH